MLNEINGVVCSCLLPPMVYIVATTVALSTGSAILRLSSSSLIEIKWQYVHAYREFVPRQTCHGRWLRYKVLQGGRRHSLRTQCNKLAEPPARRDEYFTRYKYSCVEESAGN